MASNKKRQNKDTSDYKKINLVCTVEFERWSWGKQAAVVKKVNNAIRWINLYPVDVTTGFPNIDSDSDNDLSRG